jgi:hypothetical protein
LIDGKCTFRQVNSICDFWDGIYEKRETQIDIYVWKMWYSYENSDEVIEKKELLLLLL